jgi:hypothetical protein
MQIGSSPLFFFFYLGLLLIVITVETIPGMGRGI